jgi:hypothetical protein
MATPDLLGAVIAYARAATPISSLTSTRISGTLQDAWTMPTRAIVVNGPRGGPVLADPPIRRTRLDLECYGTTPLTSKQLAETVVGVFVPPTGGSAAFRNTNAAVSVGRVELETEPIWLPDPDTGWPRTIVPLIVNWTAIP